MTVTGFIPDVAPPVTRATPAPAPAPNAFAHAVDGLAGDLASATRAEDAFASGSGDLQHAVYERARADVALTVAAAAAQRAAQAITTIENMAV